MVRENEGAVWASFLAILSVTTSVGALYLPLFMR